MFHALRGIMKTSCSAGWMTRSFKIKKSFIEAFLFFCGLCTSGIVTSCLENLSLGIFTGSAVAASLGKYLRDFSSQREYDMPLMTAFTPWNFAWRFFSLADLLQAHYCFPLARSWGIWSPRKCRYLDLKLHFYNTRSYVIIQYTPLYNIQQHRVYILRE